MRLAALQMNIRWHDRGANHQTVAGFAKQAKASGVDLLVLPEMFSTGFSMETAVTSEPLDGPTPEFMRHLARDLDMGVAGGFALGEKEGKPCNVSLVVNRHGHDVALYKKIHQIALLEEDAYYKPGKMPVCFQMGGVSAACFICYDLRFPELFRKVVDECDLIILIASWPAARQAHWDILLKARAVENQFFIAGVNRVGRGGGLDFGGGSAIIDPLGVRLAGAGGAETLVTADIEPGIVSRTRSEMPFLNDRKPWLV